MSKLMKKLEDKNDILCIAVLSHFEYLPFTFIGIDADSKTFLVTGNTLYIKFIPIKVIKSITLNEEKDR